MDGPVSLDVFIRNVVVVQELRKVLTALRADEIPVIVFKGPVLSQILQGDPRLRPMSDIDFLIRPRGRDKLIVALQKLGYSIVERYASELTLDFLWEFGSAFAAQRQVNKVAVHLDIHEHPINQQWYRLGTAIDLESLWTNSRPFLLDGVEQARQFSSEHTLIHLCLHWAAHGFVGWRRAQEIVGVAKARPLRWESLIQDAVKFRLRTTVYWALVLVGHQEPGAIPAYVIEALRPSGFRRWTLGKLAGVSAVQRDELGPGDKSRVLIHCALLDGPTDLLRIVRFAFLPGAEWLKRRYALSPEQRVVFVYFRHWARVIRFGFRGFRQVWRRAF